MIDRITPESVDYLPSGHDARLTAAKVSAFVEQTDSLPDVRLAVLGVLGAHSMNGAETLTAIISIVIAALAVLISVVATMGSFGSTVGYVFGVGFVILGGLFARVALTAHVRRMSCGV